MNRKPPAIRAITFDLDDTLWEIGPVIRAAEAHMERYLRQHFPAMARCLPAGEVRRRMNRLASQRPELAHHVTALRMTVLQQAAREAGTTPQAAELAFAEFITARNAVTPFTDAVAVLNRLSAHSRWPASPTATLTWPPPACRVFSASTSARKPLEWPSRIRPSSISPARH